MSAKKTAEISSVVKGSQLSIVEQLKIQLAEAEKSIGDSAATQSKLDEAKALVVKFTEELRPFSEARQRVSNLRQAIKSLEAPVSGHRGVQMTPEVRAKLSQSHKKIWEVRRAAKAAGAVTTTASW